MTTRRSVQLLQAITDECWSSLRERLDGLTDDEFWWEPVPDCWTVRPTPDGRWAADYAIPDPQPSPFTTIAWRIVHIAECKIMYHEYAFGQGKLTWDDLSSPHTAVDAIASLEEGHRRLVEALASLSDANLDEERLTNWGEPWPTWRIFWTMAYHDAHHGGEIGCLRDLYRGLRQT